MRKYTSTIKMIVVLVVISGVLRFIEFAGSSQIFDKVAQKFDENKFNIIASNSTKFYEKDLKKFARKENIRLDIDYYTDFEIVDKLNDTNNKYDGVWIANSIWLYMLDNKYMINDSKSIAINPVVLGIKKDKAKELGFVDNEIYNKDILNAIKDKKLKYIMTSVTKTNTGATAYLGFLNSLAGNPEVLKSEMLSNEQLINNLRDLFKGVERTSGDDEYLTEMFLNGKYNAMINYESSIISLNNKLEKQNKEPLYLIYPKDGVAINDMPFGYVNRNQEKKENFYKIQEFLRSKKTSQDLAENGFRTWYGGTSKDTNPRIFTKSWGINTEEYLVPLKYPSKKVINESLDLYAEVFRKPTHTIFCLDVSGSMGSENRIGELKDSLYYILNKEETMKDRIQFTKKDKITFIPFSGYTKNISKTYSGDEHDELLGYINRLYPNGATNIYDPTIDALKILNKENKDEYITTVILMSDGLSNRGDYTELDKYYKDNKLDIPVYSILFGDADKTQLREISEMSNGKVFNGKDGLKKAFIEVRSYN